MVIFDYVRNYFDYHFYFIIFMGGLVEAGVGYCIVHNFFTHLSAKVSVVVYADDCFGSDGAGDCNYLVN